MHFSAKFPSDGKLGTSEILHAVFGAKVKVIKHDLNLGLDVRIWVRNSYLHVRLGTRVQGYGSHMQVFGFRARYRSALHVPASFKAVHPASFKAVRPASFKAVQPAPLLFISHKLGQPVLKQAGQLRNGLSCKSGLNIHVYTWCHTQIKLL